MPIHLEEAVGRKKNMLMVIKCGKVYAQEEIGECDILIFGNSILSNGKNIKINEGALE